MRRSRRLIITAMDFFAALRLRLIITAMDFFAALRLPLPLLPLPVGPDLAAPRPRLIIAATATAPGCFAAPRLRLIIAAPALAATAIVAYADIGPWPAAPTAMDFFAALRQRLIIAALDFSAALRLRRLIITAAAPGARRYRRGVHGRVQQLYRPIENIIRWSMSA